MSAINLTVANAQRLILHFAFRINVVSGSKCVTLEWDTTARISISSLAAGTDMGRLKFNEFVPTPGDPVWDDAMVIAHKRWVYIGTIDLEHQSLQRSQLTLFEVVLFITTRVR